MQTLAIIGLGLLGGSVAAAARSRRLASRIVGHDRDWQANKLAQGLGLVDAACEQLADAVTTADVVVVCTPVSSVLADVDALLALVRPGTLITDTASTKYNIATAASRLAAASGCAFVGAHPLAGSEKTGCVHAQADLFAGRLTVLTPTNHNADTDLERAVAFWQSLGARVERMSPEEHDQALAFTSHLPHLLASALIECIPSRWLSVSGPGLRDATRIAAGQPSLWTDIFLDNWPALSIALEAFKHRLDQLTKSLAAADRERLLQLLREGKDVRDQLGS